MYNSDNKSLTLAEAMEKYGVTIITNEKPVDKSITDGMRLYQALEYLNLGEEKQEICGMIAVNSLNQPIGIYKITIGLANSSQIHPREVFREAIKLNAIGIFLFHNHPSGGLKASESDLSITKRVKKTGDIIGIKLLDHIIISKNGFTNIKETNSDIWDM